MSSRMDRLQQELRVVEHAHGTRDERADLRKELHVGASRFGRVEPAPLAA